MYQAIVFLPLIGAIVAGLISLAGARARHPGGSAKDHKDHHAHPEPGAAAHDDGHGAAEPAATGSRSAELITTVLLFIAMILSWIAFAALASVRMHGFRSRAGSPSATCGSIGRCGSTRSRR